MENKGFKLIAFRFVNPNPNTDKLLTDDLANNATNNGILRNENPSIWKKLKKECLSQATKLIINKWYYFNRRSISISKHNIPINVNCIVGKNGCGKTTIINAILYLFLRYNNSVSNIYSQNLNILCELKYSINGEIKIARSFTREKSDSNSIDNIFSLFFNYSIHSFTNINFDKVNFDHTNIIPVRNSEGIELENIDKQLNNRLIKACLLYDWENNNWPLRYINDDTTTISTSFSYPNGDDNTYLFDEQTHNIVLQYCLKKYQLSNNRTDFHTFLMFHIYNYYCTKLWKDDPTVYQINHKPQSAVEFYDRNREYCNQFIQENIEQTNIKDEIPTIHHLLLFLKLSEYHLIGNSLGKKTINIKKSIAIRVDSSNSYTRDLFYFNQPFHITKDNLILSTNDEQIIDDIDIYLEDLMFQNFLNHSVAIKYKNGKERSLSNISSGEKQLLLIKTEMMINLLNIENRKDSGDQYVNAFFDEVELYLHPEWQRKFLSNLIDGINLIKFKNIKGINITIATHSPFILSDVPKSNVLFLNEDGTPADKSKIGETFGANIHDLLKDGFFMESTIGEVARREIQKIVDFYYEVQDDNKKNLNERNADLEKRKAENKEHFEYIGSIIGDQYYKNTINFMLDEIYDRKKTDKLDDFLKGLSEEEKKALKEKL